MVGGACFGADVVAVLPVGEGAAELDVAEVVVPGELGDLGVPGEADGREGESAEGEGEPGAGAGGDASVSGCRTGWARAEVGEGGLLDAGLLPGGHEAGQVFGVGEEGEDDARGIGKPLLGVKVWRIGGWYEVSFRREIQRRSALSAMPRR